MLHSPHIKITITCKYKCLQRNRDDINLYSEHFYGCRYERLGQELEIHISVHNHERVVRGSDGKVRRRARKLEMGQGTMWEEPPGLEVGKKLCDFKLLCDEYVDPLEKH